MQTTFAIAESVELHVTPFPNQAWRFLYRRLYRVGGSHFKSYRWSQACERHDFVSLLHCAWNQPPIVLKVQ